MPNILRFPGNAKPSRARFTHATTSHRGVVYNWRADACGLIREIPDEWTAITGQSIADAAELGWMHAIHPDEHDRIARRWFRAVGSATPLTLEFRIKIITGEYATLRCKVEPVFDTDGQITHWEGQSLVNVKISPRLISINE